ncbi:unnamed protein product, partial [Pleuronectes platessa]
PKVRQIATGWPERLLPPQSPLSSSVYEGQNRKHTRWLYMPCDHRTRSSLDLASPLTSMAAVLGGPRGERRPRTCPVATAGQCVPGTRLAGCWVLQPHRGPQSAAKTKAVDVGGFALPAPQKPGEKKEHFLPLHPR